MTSNIEELYEEQDNSFSLCKSVITCVLGIILIFAIYLMMVGLWIWLFNISGIVGGIPSAAIIAEYTLFILLCAFVLLGSVFGIFAIGFLCVFSVNFLTEACSYEKNIDIKLENV